MLYLIPPHKKFTKNYFATKTLLSHFPIEKSKEDIKFSIDQFKKYKEGVSIRGWAFIKGEQVDKTRKYLILEHNKNSYIVDTIPWRRGDITKHFHAKDLSHAGFIAHIYFSDFPSGEYKLSLLLVDSDGSQHMVSCHAPLFIGGTIYEIQKDKEEALNYFDKALKLAEQIEYKWLIDALKGNVLND